MNSKIQKIPINPQMMIW